MMHIGAYAISPPIVLAPMAGVTDLPFRRLCKQLGAGLTVSEMMSANPKLVHTDKTRRRRDHTGEPGPISVQIAGYDAQQMADCARDNVAHGAQIIDINMGCPAKKVCAKDSGSALMRDETNVAAILTAVVKAVEVPVTLKIRTGFCHAQRNGVNIAKIAEDCGIAALAVHGRTREDHFKGSAEYNTIAAIKQAVRIPVLANGDITTPQQAQQVLQHTGCDGVMIGRAAQGKPWIFREFAHYLATGCVVAPPSRAEIRDWLLAHLADLYDFYGEYLGVRIARKHIQWYCQAHEGADAFWQQVNQLTDAPQQLAAVAGFWE